MVAGGIVSNPLYEGNANNPIYHGDNPLFSCSVNANPLY